MLDSIPGRRDPFAVRARHTGRLLVRYRWLYFMLIPAIAYYIVFKFVPILNLRIVFQRYSPQLEQLGQSAPWLGLENFRVFFSHRDFGMLLSNTLILAVLNILFYFPVPIFLALLLNEVRIARVRG